MSTYVKFTAALAAVIAFGVGVWKLERWLASPSHPANYETFEEPSRAAPLPATTPAPRTTAATAAAPVPGKIASKRALDPRDGAPSRAEAEPAVPLEERPIHRTITPVGGLFQRHEHALPAPSNGDGEEGSFQPATQAPVTQPQGGAEEAN